MKYLGLSIADKPALEEEKARGKKYVVIGCGRILNFTTSYPIYVGTDYVSIHIDAALAQIAEMERDEQYMSHADIFIEEYEESQCVAQSEREQNLNGCEYCNRSDFEDIVCYIPNNETGGFLEVPTNICPNCGKRLKA